MGNYGLCQRMLSGRRTRGSSSLALFRDSLRHTQLIHPPPSSKVVTNDNRFHRGHVVDDHLAWRREAPHTTSFLDTACKCMRKSPDYPIKVEGLASRPRSERV
jgi:hypothetical protein